MMKRIVVSLVLALFLLTNPVTASSWLDGDLFERNDGGYFTLATESGEVITKTARILDTGDSYIAADNMRYEVIDHDQDTVIVIAKEKIILPDVADILQTNVSTSQLSLWQRLFGTSANTNDDSGAVWSSIAIYHTHNAESYVPTSGIDSNPKGNGDIMDVGKQLDSSLRSAGYQSHWSDNSHIPHDGQAYLRSRRTAVEMVQQYQPATLIDVHRDATPPDVYQTEIEGQPTTKVRIVVGRQNQNREATLEYAKRIKAVADQMYPGIIEGIFDARGNYNQDLGPQVILLEFGAHTTSLGEAEQSTKYFAKIIPAAAGISSAAASRSSDGQVGSVARSSIWWILAIVAILALGFVILNKQGIGSLGRFFSREFAGKKPDDTKDD